MMKPDCCRSDLEGTTASYEKKWYSFALSMSLFSQEKILMVGNSFTFYYNLQIQ